MRKQRAKCERDAPRLSAERHRQILERAERNKWRVPW
jgi:hypothetical protein